jgi:hypothetical protein
MEDGSNGTGPFEGEERRQKREKRWRRMKTGQRGNPTLRRAEGI